MSDKYYLKILHFGYKNNQRFMALVVLLLSDHNDLKVVGGGSGSDSFARASAAEIVLGARCLIFIFERLY